MDPAPDLVAAPFPDLGGRLWIDASAGVAGDMLLGALLDLGVPLEVVRGAVDAVIPGAVTIDVREVRRAGLRASKAAVTPRVADHPHRHWSEIEAMLAGADVNARTRELALAAFGRLAEAEARVHGVAVTAVHFHEVGSWDSIADVVGVCAALDWLGIESITASPVALGSGEVQVAHGRMAVPVPAVLELARGWQVTTGGTGELATPTGLALVTALAEGCGPLGPALPRAVGVGAGTRDPADRANVVRVVLAAPAEQPSAAEPISGTVQLEANVDDLDPRLWPGVLTDLLDAGAVDAWLTPVLMKKGRPAHVLAALVPAERLDRLVDTLFSRVPTLGVRWQPVERATLDRTWRTVAVDGVPVRVKLGVRTGRVLTATPEFDDVRAAARSLGKAERDVLARATAEADAAGYRVGAAAGPAGGSA